MNGEESDEEENARLAAKELGGMKVLHGLDKVVEGGAVVLTLKDQSILAGDDIIQVQKAAFLSGLSLYFHALVVNMLSFLILLSGNHHLRLLKKLSSKGGL